MSDVDSSFAAAPEHAAENLMQEKSSKGLNFLLLEAVRSCVLLAPRWQRVHATPWTIVSLVLLYLLAQLAAQRSMIAGEADFNWSAISSDWLGFALLAWLSYWLIEKTEHEVKPAQATALIFGQIFVFTVFFGAVFTVLVKTNFYNQEKLDLIAQWAAILLPISWAMLAQLVVLWRVSTRKIGPILLALLLLLANAAMSIGTSSIQFWNPRVELVEEEDPETLEITQEVMEAQPVLLEQTLSAVKAERPGVVDLFSITFAPYSEENVFHDETAMVSKVMAERFDTTGRGVQLVNHLDTVGEFPWATPLNLKRAVFAVAGKMNKQEDILFMHLSSHGASDGQLAASFPPMTIEEVTPDDLKAWLDEAGVKNRVISISACFAGNWVPPLANENTLVMTASDADHTSYGCGRKSPLTFFGRAMYDEQLRNQTLSFETAHAAARIVIKQREEEAGKTDGYSNPQIRMGEAIRLRLALLQDRLQKNKGSSD